MKGVTYIGKEEFNNDCERMMKRLLEIDKQLYQLSKELERLPQGNFFIKNNGKYEKWMYYLDGKEIYIPKKDKPLAEGLAKRKYLELRKRRLEIEKTAINAYLKKCNKHIDEESLIKNKAYQKLLSEAYIPLQEELAIWANADYKPNDLFRNRCIFKCLSGHVVRTKAEMTIDQALFSKQIPFRYESELIVNGDSKYPDFTIRHPKTGAFYYWEHLGLMNQEKYRNKNVFKVNDYMRSGIYPGKNLILTYENDEYSLDASEVDRIIDYYFGD